MSSVVDKNMHPLKFSSSEAIGRYHIANETMSTLHLLYRVLHYSGPNCAMCRMGIGVEKRERSARGSYSRAELLRECLTIIR